MRADRAPGQTDPKDPREREEPIDDHHRPSSPARCEPRQDGSFRDRVPQIHLEITPRATWTTSSMPSSTSAVPRALFYLSCRAPPSGERYAVHALHWHTEVTGSANMLGGSSASRDAAPEDEPGDAVASRAGEATEHAIAEQLAVLRHEIALRDEFISTAAHELRNPISPVYIQLEHLKETIRTSSEPIARPWLMAQLEALTMRLDRFLETLNRLLDASRLGAGHLVLFPQPCDLGEGTPPGLR